jgi:hypothetical protein
MKKIYIIVLVLFLAVLFLVGCFSAKFTIPDEPKFRQLYVYPVKDGVCLDSEGVGILNDNVKALKDYADKMRKILEGMK